MSQNMNLTHDEQQALDHVERTLGGAATRGLPDVGELCKKYREIRGTIEVVLRIVERIPGTGTKIANVIRFLMSLADAACPVS